MKKHTLAGIITTAFVLIIGYIIFVTVEHDNIDQPKPTPDAPRVATTNPNISIENITPNTEVKSPLHITGKARGTWYFEASFPVVLIDANNKIVAETAAKATTEWMTEDFVPFDITLQWNTQPTTSEGKLILKKDNPSGLPEHDQQIEIPVKFW